jgi:hypothetical protein
MTEAVTGISKRRLVLHFGIKDTIIASEKAAGLKTNENVRTEVSQGLGCQNSLQSGMGSNVHNQQWAKQRVRVGTGPRSVVLH